MIGLPLFAPKIVVHSIGDYKLYESSIMKNTIILFAYIFKIICKIVVVFFGCFFLFFFFNPYLKLFLIFVILKKMLC